MKERTKKQTAVSAGVTEQDHLDLRNMLLGMRERVADQIAALRTRAIPQRDAANTEEDGTGEYDREMALDLASSKRGTVLDIDEALARLDQGAYGQCEMCQCSIERPRILALPFVRTCIGCQSKLERQR